MRRKIPRYQSKDKGWGGWKLGVVLVAVMLLAVGVWQFKQRRWDERLGMNVAVVDGKKIRVMSVKPSEKRVLIYDLPENLMVGVPKMKGSLRVGSLWKFGEGEKHPLELTGRAVEMFLGVKLDGVVYYPGWTEKTGRFYRSKKTDLGLVDQILLSWYWSGIRPGEMEIKQLPVITPERQRRADGVEVLEVDSERLNNVRRDFGIKSIVNRGERVRVWGKGESQRGLMVRMLESAGGVVLDESSGEAEGECEVRVGEEMKDSDLVFFLKKKFGCRVKEGEAVSGVVEVTLGKSWERRYSTESE